MVAARVRAVRDGLAAAAREAGTPPATIIAITKYLHDDAIPVLYAAGLRHFGEARVEQLTRRATGIDGLDGACWEMVGRLQSRQAVATSHAAARIHSLASTSAARRLARAIDAGDQQVAECSLLVQVNVDGDPAKAGVPSSGLAGFLEELPPAIRIDGLMTMPAATTDPESSRPAFARLRELRDELQAGGSPHPLDELSMGTSQDWFAAAREGATCVRIGTGLYTLPGAGPA